MDGPQLLNPSYHVTFHLVTLSQTCSVMRKMSCKIAFFSYRLQTILAVSMMRLKYCIATAVSQGSVSVKLSYHPIEKAISVSLLSTLKKQGTPILSPYWVVIDVL
ncbi:MAG: hypothetical protein JW795_20085 [Chitinivibrionales bacterium]|nr:hypothetical protein [Chitinivibrionales bacterium]